MIDWNKLTTEDSTKIDRIAQKALRSIPVLTEHGFQSLSMDLSAAHLATPLDLEKLETFDLGNFTHDITGIVAHIDRSTGKMNDCFLPRCTAPESKIVTGLGGNISLEKVARLAGHLEKTELETVKGNAPECPTCGTWNAMLDNYEQETYRRLFECRDCGHKVYKDEAVVIIKQLDKPGMGDQSTYTEIEAVPGEKF